MIKGWIEVTTHELKYPLCIKGVHSSFYGREDVFYERVDSAERMKQLSENWRLFYLDETPSIMEEENKRLREALEENRKLKAGIKNIIAECAEDCSVMTSLEKILNIVNQLLK